MINAAGYSGWHRRYAFISLLALTVFLPLVPWTGAVAQTDYWIALQANNQTYVRAGVTQNTLLAVGSPHVRGWETFKLIRLDDGKVALQSKQNGLYVRAGVGQQSLLAAVSSHIRGWETFRLMGQPGRTALQSVQSGSCVRVLENGYLSATAECISADTFQMLMIP